MPRVADYGGRRVALDPLGAPRAAAVSAAPGLEVAGQALGQVADVAEKFQLEADITSAKAIDTAFRAQVLEAGMGDGGFYTLAGENAVRGHEAYSKSVDKLYHDAKGKLGTGRAGRLAGDALDDFVLSERARATQHYRREQAVHADDTSKARTQLAAAEGVAFYNDDPTFRRSLDTIAHEALERGQRAGSSEERIAADVLGLQSKMIAAAVKSASERNPRDALVLYQKWQHRLDAGTRAATSHIVFDAARKVSSIEISERVLERGGSQQAQLAAVREIEDVELRDSVRTRINQFWTDQRLARTAAERDLDSSVTAQIQSGHIKYLEDLPSVGGSGAARRGWERLITARSGGLALAPDHEAWIKWHTMPTAELARPEPGGEWAAKLGPEYDEFVKSVGAARRKVAGQSPTAQLTRETINQQVSLFARAAGLYAKPSDNEHQQTKHRDFDNYVRLELQRFKDPSFDDLLGVLQQATRAYTVDAPWSFAETRLGFELAPEDFPNVELTDEDREAARAHLVGQGIPPTDEAIDALFRDFLGSGIGTGGR